MARTKIMQLDYDSGELIKIYESIKAAAEDNWLNALALTNALKAGNGTAVYKNKELVFTRAYSATSLL